MEKINENDLELINRARTVIRENYDVKNFNHTVGAAVRCASGSIYTGVNIYALHGACAEMIAIGSAIANGERSFTTIVAVRGIEGAEVISPCGNCRQFLNDYAPDCRVFIKLEDTITKVKINSLLPYAYHTKNIKE